MTHEKPEVETQEILPGLATQANRSQRFAAVGGLALASLFTGIIAAVLVVTALEGSGSIVTESMLMTKLKVLAEEEAAGSEALRAVYREEDARVRQAHEMRQRRMDIGVWLLLAGLVAMAACGRWYLALDAKLPRPHKAGEPHAKGPSPRALGVAALVALVVLLAAAAVTLSFMVVHDTPRSADATHDGNGTSVDKTPTPTPAAVVYADNWPAFRGDGMGVVAGGEWPVKWNGKTGENVAWKTLLPLDGNSSPVIWGGRIFLTAGDKKTQKVICIDRTTGAVLWEASVASEETKKRIAQGEEGELTQHEDTGFAASTGVTEGKRFYCMFAGADVAAVDFEGKVSWVVNLGPYDSSYGLSASLAFAEDTVIAQLDQGASPEDGRSKLYGLDPATGAILWSWDRPVGASWSSPVIATTPKHKLILTVSNPWVIAYDAKEAGTELWRFTGMHGDVAASPVYADGLIYVTGDTSEVYAIRVGGSGDVTNTHKAWSADQGMSDAPSPVSDGKYFLQCLSQGSDVSCYDAKTGKLLWIESVAGHYASPTLVGDTVYVTDIEGKTRLLKWGPTFEVIGTNDLGEWVYATPAFGDGKIYIRGKKHLFAIGTK